MEKMNICICLFLHMALKNFSCDDLVAVIDAGVGMQSVGI